MADPGPEAAVRRRRWPAILVLALVALVAIGFAYFERIAAWAAVEALAIRYHLPSQVHIDQIGTDQAKIALLSLGSDRQVSAADVSLQFNASALRIDRIEIGRLEVHGRYDGHALSLGELDPMLRDLTAGNGSGSGPPPSIILHRLVVTIDTPLGTLSGDGMATIDHGIIYSQFALNEPEQRSAIHLDLNAALGNDTPQPQGKVTADLKSDSVLWEVFGLPRPTAGSLHFEAQLKAPGADASASGIRVATGALVVAADWSFSADSLAWPGQAAPLALQGGGRAVLSQRRLDIPKFDIKSTGGWSPDLALHAQGAGTAGLDAGKSSAQATIDLSAQAKSAAFGALQTRAPAVDLGLQVQFADGKLAIQFSRDSSIKLAQATIGPTLKLDKPTTITFKKSDQSRIMLPLPEADGSPIAGSLALGAFATQITLPSLAAPVQLAFPGGTLGFSFGSGLPLRYSLDLKNAEATLTQPALAVKKLSIGVKGEGGKFDLTFGSGALTGPSGVGPTTLDGRAGLNGSKLSLTSKLAFAAGRANLSTKGDYDLTLGKGQFDVTMPLVTFVPGGLQPRDLFPALAATTEDVAGTVAVKGPITIEKGALASNLEVNFQGMSGKFGPITLRNLNSVIVVSRPWPVTTAPDQIVSIELADVGLPLTNGLVRFKVDDGTTLTLAESHLEMMGGHVTLDPAILKLGAPAQQIHLNVDRVSLANMFQLFSVAGLSGDGVLSGAIPVTLFPAGLAIDHAKLEAQAPGTLRYDQTQGPAALTNTAGSVKMALSALSDFHYDRLEIDLDRAATGDTELGLHISGRNPSFYNGYPVEFNLSVAGKLDEALRKGLAGYQVPDMIRERLKSFNH